MQISLYQIFVWSLGLVSGAVIGLAFGAIQERAAQKYLRLQSEGKFNNGWAAVPGSMRRTGYFLMILAAIQLICPLLFNNGCQWWVSGGVVAGYGWALWRKLRLSLAEHRAR